MLRCDKTPPPLAIGRPNVTKLQLNGLPSTSKRSAKALKTLKDKLVLASRGNALQQGPRGLKQEGGSEHTNQRLRSAVKPSFAITQSTEALAAETGRDACLTRERVPQLNKHLIGTNVTNCNGATCYLGSDLRCTGLELVYPYNPEAGIARTASQCAEA